MPENLSFVKLEGLGNDFVLLDLLDRPPEAGPDLFPSLARTLCDRHFGVGADGLLLLLPSGCADFSMRIFNPDGTEAQMCGNGIRCLAAYVSGKKLVKKDNFTVETRAGLRKIGFFPGDAIFEAEVDMGVPAVLSRREDGVSESFSVQPGGLPAFSGTAVSMGNPHFVIFLDSLENLPLDVWGPAIERHPFFPEGTNVEFCSVEEGRIRVLVWERGAGATLACGTGACAAFAAASFLGLAGDRVEVVLPGGSLFIRRLPDGSLLMRGPAREVFRGEYIR